MLGVVTRAASRCHSRPCVVASRWRCGWSHMFSSSNHKSCCTKVQKRHRNAKVAAGNTFCSILCCLFFCCCTNSDNEATALMHFEPKLYVPTKAQERIALPSSEHTKATQISLFLLQFQASQL